MKQTESGTYVLQEGVSGDFRFDIAGPNNDFLDENHPVFVLNY